MHSEQKTFKIKLTLFAFGIFIIILVFGINKLLINRLRNEAHQQVQLLAESYSDAINSDNEEDIRFVMDILLPSLNFPIIITSNNEISSIMNLDISLIDENLESIKHIWEIVDEMDAIYQPLDLKWNGMKWGRIHFSDPRVVTQLQWMPYIEIGCSIIFIIISLWGFHIIRQSERNMIYAGMAKETAHQLGTPISSLMGWSKLLKEKQTKNSLILSSIDEDISRLKEISERFSKIGSKPKFKKVNLYDLVYDSMTYMHTRLPENSQITIDLKGSNNLFIQGDWTLLSWGIENLLKNSVDAISYGVGSILIDIMYKKRHTSIIITDSGKGIHRKNWKNIFYPGFSSKQRGWGLGLTLTSRIIKDIHNGDIRLLRSKPGKTIFEILFYN